MKYTDYYNLWFKLVNAYLFYCAINFFSMNDIAIYHVRSWIMIEEWIDIEKSKVS